MTEKEKVNRLLYFNNSYRSRDRIDCTTHNSFIDRAENRHRVFTSYNEQSTVALMCPKCFKWFKVILNRNSSFSVDYDLDDTNGKLETNLMNVNYSGKCSGCERRVIFIDIDIELADIISTLNRKGYTTQFCCSGHVPYARRFILFDSEYNFPSSPRYWRLMVNNNINYSRSEIIIELKDYTQFKQFNDFNLLELEKNSKIIKSILFDELNNWVNSLPQYNKREKHYVERKNNNTTTSL